MFRSTYQMAPAPPPAMEWEEYRHLVTAKWEAFLDSPIACDERNVQEFLEQHPVLLPPPIHPSHPAFPYGVISQPPLQGLTKRVPDFMWICKDSGNFHVILIEIETPAKRWYTDAGEETAEIRHALGQLIDWQSWFDDHGVRYFCELFQVPDHMRRGRDFKLHLRLICGRRREFDNRPALSRKRGQTEANYTNAQFMTFDRLAPCYDTRDYMCVKVEQGQFRALSLSPVTLLGPVWGTSALPVTSKAEAVEQNPYMNAPRKAFVRERLCYWDEQARIGAIRSYRTSDVE